MNKCLPIPTADVPLADILEYKLRRKDEYDAFKAFMGELHLEIVNSNDIPRSKNMVISRLENSIADLQRLSSESFVKKIDSSFSFNFSLQDVIVKAGAGATFASSISIPAPIGALAGALYSSLNFKVSKRVVPDDLMRAKKGLHSMDKRITAQSQATP